MNRFFDIPGDLSVQLAPWEIRRRGLGDGRKALFELKQPVRFRSDVAGGVIMVPEDYVSDLASIPQFAWSIFMAPDDPRIELGAWVHDLLYQLQGMIWIENDGGRELVSLTRLQCDRILCLEAMADLGATGFQRKLVYQSLRRLGDGWACESFWERFKS